MIVAPQEEKKIVYKGAMVVKPGLTIWQLDLTTLIIEKYVRKDSMLAIDGSANTQVLDNGKILYCQALNLKNAKKRFTKMLNIISNDINKASSIQNREISKASSEMGE